jgi:hypothetical protein
MTTVTAKTLTKIKNDNNNIIYDGNDILPTATLAIAITLSTTAA